MTEDPIPELQKVELHVHMEGAVPAAFMRRLAQEKKKDFSQLFTDGGDYRRTDFLELLETYAALAALPDSPEDYARLTREMLQQSAAGGVIYTEAFLCPAHCCNNDLGAWKEITEAVREAAEAAETDLGVTLRLIVSSLRHQGPAKVRAAAQCAAETAGDFVVGFGMSGDEARGKFRDFTYAFDMAREAELGLTVHAGEWGPSRMVREAVEELRVSRIGPAPRAVEDPAVLELLRRHDVTVEACPGAGVALGLYPDLAHHPVEQIRRSGVKLTISTDDPAYFGLSMASEYAALRKTFGWDDEIFAQIAKTALDAAFCDTVTKAKLAKRLETAP
ncbi:adenosine deaminase [Pseudooceanicola algae]|uniref:Cyclic adenylate deaminase n=1 Tax=Pseudooceanicola algae TaxID=1537215 RepID=A0A418SHD3_9RHOB|nr:adenosine deaminase [Pseudooceanicola algae]QPM90373.1 Cyclic adenylate deaminase [Pseudooceanicola algae]